MNRKAYVSLFALIFVATTVFLIFVSSWIQTYDGDLTRFGNVSERNYGWNHPLTVFREDHTAYYINDRKADYKVPSDIIVFGDSFSHLPLSGERRNYGWPSFLYELYGLTTFVYHIEDVSVLDWLDRHKPEEWPDYIVYQRVERRFKAWEAPLLPERTCSINMQPFEYEPFPLLPMPESTKQLQRDTFSPFAFDVAIHWIRGQINTKSKAYEFPLTRTDLFSNKKNDHILVMRGKFSRDKAFTDDKVRNITCYLWETKQKAESNGRTKFIIAVVPDKFTAYAPYIDTDKTSINVYDAFAKQGLYVYRFDRYFREHIGENKLGPDIFQPNDTHYGPQGARILASGIYALMQR